ncbi:MAG: type II secretion system F family protein, partial [Desulforhopalus sp.]
MPVFEYRALDATGKNIKGILDADSEQVARSKLRSQGKYPVSITRSRTRQSAADGRGIGFGIFERVKSEELSVMTRQLATLLGAGIPLVQALDGLLQQTRNATLKRVVAQIKGSVNEGNTLTNALGEHPKLFSSIFINMVRAGEASGALDVVLERLADFAEKQEALKGRLRAALVYPLFMAVIGSAILFVLIAYIVPNITQVFNEMDRVLPLPTLFLIGLSDFLKMYWWVLIIFIIGFILVTRSMLRRPSGRALWDLVKLKVFMIGPVVRKVIL